MKTSLLALLLVLAGFAAGEWFATAYLQRPLRVECEGPKPVVELREAGALNGDGACELSWAICWRRT